MKPNEKYNRIRPLKIWEILQKETDEEHPMGTEELRARLRECGIDSHRTTIYEDIKLLNDCGYEIMTRRGRGNLYYVMDRKFSDPEIHVLLDAVQGANPNDFSARVWALDNRKLFNHTRSDLEQNPKLF